MRKTTTHHAVKTGSVDKSPRENVSRIRVVAKAATDGLGCAVTFSGSYVPRAKQRRGDLRSDWKSVGETMYRVMQSAK